MKTVITKEITGFKVSVIVTDNNKLAVRLDNDSGEYVGQLFSSIDNVSDLFSRLSSGEKLSADDMKKIKDAYNKDVKTESKISRLLRMKSESLTTGILLTDLTSGNVKLRKGSTVLYSVDKGELFIQGFPENIKLDGNITLGSLIK